jgi:arylsulfatase A-like enzyme
VKPNIILISIDTLRSDHVSCYGHDKLTTPCIDKLAEEGTIFGNNYTTGVWTPPAHASMLTGLFVSEHGVYGNRKLSRDIPTIAEILKKNGYRTGGFVNNSQVGELVGFERGHDLFIEVWKGIKTSSHVRRIYGGAVRRMRDKLGIEDMGAGKTNKLFMDWVEKQEGRENPFYAFIHYIEPHNPLNPPRRFRNKFVNYYNKYNNMEKIKKVAYNPLICYVDDLTLNEEEIGYIKALYDGEIAYNDSKIGEIIIFLKKKDLYENTMIIITSDHGEHFGEYGYWSHVASLYREVLHVPLIVKFPKGFDRVEEISEYTQSVDIFPTVLEVANVTGKESYQNSGVSLVFHKDRANPYRDYVFTEWEGRVPFFILDKVKNQQKDIDLELFKTQMALLQDKKYKYIWKSNDSEELYDISGDQDKRLNIHQHSDIRNYLHDELFKRKREYMDLEDRSRNDIDEDIVKNLKSLGYL